jgi:hypothetical protein
MDQLQEVNTVVAGALGALTLIVLYYLYSEKEAAVPYHVEPPEQTRPGWKGKILDEPSLTV